MAASTALLASPKPSQSTRIGASANTGTAWLSKSTGSSQRRSPADSVMSSAEKIPSAIPQR